MKALVYTAPQRVELRDVPDPRPGAGEVLVRVEAAGICGSDMHAFHGRDERRPPPLILGHEASGTVRGGELDGRRAVVNPLVTCGRCDACLDGRSNLCAAREIISMPPREGAFAQWLRIPERNLVPLPEGLSSVHAALAEPVATALHAVNVLERAARRPLAEGRALVLGAGSIGIAAARLLAARGCLDIAIADTSALRRATAARLGCCTVLDPAAAPRAPGRAEFVVDAVGAAATRAAASAAVAPGGVIVHVGLLDAADGLDVRRLTLQEIAFVGTYTYTMVDFRAAVTAIARGVLGALDWVETRDLADGPAAFADLHHGRTGAAKIVLSP